LNHTPKTRYLLIIWLIGSIFTIRHALQCHLTLYLMTTQTESIGNELV